jgi:hypothetical protein
MRLVDYVISKCNRLNKEKMSAINSNHIFADNTARDTYFAANPTEKVPSLIISVGSGYQEWNGTAWIAKTGIVGAGDAIYIAVQDAGSYFTGTDVEVALQELGLGKINKTQIVDDLTTGGIKDVLSAEQGKILNTNKVEKEIGKGLSENDYVNIDKAKVDNLPDNTLSQLNDLLFSPQVAINTDYTLVLTDAGKMLVVSDNDPVEDITITIPKNSDVAFPINTEIKVVRYTLDNEVDIAPVDVDVTVLSKASNKKVDGQYGVITLRKMAEDTWLLIGELKA